MQRVLTGAALGGAGRRRRGLRDVRGVRVQSTCVRLDNTHNNSRSVSDPFSSPSFFSFSLLMTIDDCLPLFLLFFAQIPEC